MSSLKDGEGYFVGVPEQVVQLVLREPIEED